MVGAGRASSLPRGFAVSPAPTHDPSRGLCNGNLAGSLPAEAMAGWQGHGAASLWTTGTGLTQSHHWCPSWGCCCGPPRLCRLHAVCSCFLPMPRCQPGWFNLQPHNPAGCTSCFCYGHSTACMAADGYEVTHVRSDFSQGTNPSASGVTEAQLHRLQPEISGGLGRLGLGIPLWG